MLGVEIVAAVGDGGERFDVRHRDLARREGGASAIVTRGPVVPSATASAASLRGMDPFQARNDTGPSADSSAHAAAASQVPTARITSASSRSGTSRSSSSRAVSAAADQRERSSAASAARPSRTRSSGSDMPRDTNTCSTLAIARTGCNPQFRNWEDFLATAGCSPVTASSSRGAGRARRRAPDPRSIDR